MDEGKDLFLKDIFQKVESAIIYYDRSLVLNQKIYKNFQYFKKKYPNEEDLEGDVSKTYTKTKDISFVERNYLKRPLRVINCENQCDVYLELNNTDIRKMLKNEIVESQDFYPFDSGNPFI